MNTNLPAPSPSLDTRAHTHTKNFFMTAQAMKTIKYMINLRFNMVLELVLVQTALLYLVNWVQSINIPKYIY